MLLVGAVLMWFLQEKSPACKFKTYDKNCDFSKSLKRLKYELGKQYETITKYILERIRVPSKVQTSLTNQGTPSLINH